ncbi:MAG: PASTA domain-containing protein [Candidatus Poriferisodalaceae bacterium]
MPLDESDELTGRVLDDRYRLMAYQTHAQASVNYLAHDLETGDHVSIKVFGASISEDLEFSRRLVVDTTKAALVSHRCVERVYDWGRFQESAYVVVEHYPGVTLRSFLAAGYTLNPAQVVKLGVELASGLEALHGNGICHGDISPSNVILGLDTSSKLSAVYLGNALRAAEAGRLEIVGTGVDDRSQEFLAPETSRGLSSPESDVYSLAMTLRVAAEEGSTTNEAADAAARPKISKRQDLGQAQDILESALDPDPDVRCDAKSLTKGLIDAAASFVKPPPVAIPESLASPLLAANRSQQRVLAEAAEFDQVRWRPMWKVGAAALGLLMLLSAATAWAVSSVRPQGVSAHLVDQYTGRTIGEVRAIADSVAWILDEDQVRTDELPSGIVIAQRPEAGSRLAEGAMLIVEVASGPRLRMTPLVIGLSTEAASARLATKGFEVDLVQPLYDETIAAGEVMKLMIDGETELGGSLREPGTRAVLVVSGGPVPRTVPQLIGLDQESAEEALNALQLSSARTLSYEVSDSVLEGLVLRQSLTPGLLVERGSTVSLTLSAGPDRREVPDMRGLTVSEAEQRLVEVGLKLGDVAGEGELVQATEPPAGTMLAPDSAVLLWVLSD